MRMEERLASLITDNILPHLVPELEMLSWRRTHVLAVHVYPGAGRPHYIKRAGLERAVYVRVGSTNRHADQELLEELRHFARGEASGAKGNPCAFPWSALAQHAILCRREPPGVR